MCPTHTRAIFLIWQLLTCLSSYHRSSFLKWDWLLDCPTVCRDSMLAHSLSGCLCNSKLWDFYKKLFVASRCWKIYMHVRVCVYCLWIVLVSINGQSGSALMWSLRHFQTQLVVDELLNSVKKAALSGRKCSRWTFPAPPHAFSLTESEDSSQRSHWIYTYI